MAELTIIIVNWNTRDLLKRCVESIERNPPAVSCEVFVVDNASADGSHHFLRDMKALKNGASVRLIENADNLGFAKANNQAIAQSTAPLILLLNPDTEVRQGAIDALVKTLKSKDEIGVCGPRLLNTNGSLQPSVWSTIPGAVYCLLDDLHLYKLLPRKFRAELLLGRYWDHSSRRVVKSLSGAVMMVKREAVDEVGAYNEKYHMYGEDAEWQTRIGRAGWKMVFEPVAEIVHHGGQSTMRRWSDKERRLREVEASLSLQRDYNSSISLMINTFVKALTLALLRLRRRLRQQNDDYLDDLISLQMSYCKFSLFDLIKRVRW